MDPPAGLAWTAGQVAKNLGISESTLRTWHRRYGLGPHDTEPGRYRRYQAADVARLRRMLELVSAGTLASEAARLVQGGEPAAVPAARDLDALVEAARSLDTARCAVLLDTAFARRGVVEAWELVCCPALRAVDGEPRDDPALMAVEHALSWALLGALHRLPRLSAAPGTAHALLACAEEEQHTLPLAALAAALAERRRPSRVLGAATPAPTLEQAVVETRPDAVVLWAQRAETANPDVLHALSRHPTLLVAAGPGWDPRQLAGSRRVTTLREALTALERPSGPKVARPP
jgi:DNA-binding transcriptional MerR regulator